LNVMWTRVLTSPRRRGDDPPRIREGEDVDKKDFPLLR
jgi:hypothetical protein